MCQGPTSPVTDSKTYRDASGREVPRFGRVTPTFRTQTGGTIGVTFERMKVAKPLVSVGELVKKGHKVWMSGGDSYIETASGEQIPIYLRDGVFVLPAWHTGGF